MGNKIKNFFIGIWERINQIDIPDGNDNLTKEEMAEVKRANEVQGKVHEQRSFVPRVDVSKRKSKEENDPLIAKYGKAERGNPIYDTAMRINDREKSRGEVR